MVEIWEGEGLQTLFYKKVFRFQRVGLEASQGLP
jgi:hypothetical protein